MVPLWAAILIGLASGALGTLLTIGHERGAEIRTRMLEAADDYLQALFEMSREMGELRRALEEPVRPPQAKIDEILGRLQHVEDRLAPLRGRLQLLFGESPTLAATIAVGERIEGVRSEFAAWAANEPNGKVLTYQAVEDLAAAVAEFTTLARRALRYGVLSRLVGWIVDRTVHTPVHTPTLEKGD